MLTTLWLTTWLLLNCGGAVQNATTAQSRAAQIVASSPVPATYFGMHVHYPTNSNPYIWPSVHFGSYRSWDNLEGVCWPAIQRGGSDSYDWSALDAAVLKAQSEGKEFLYTLGPSPAQPWAVIDSKTYSRGQCGSATVPSTSNEPNHTRWKQFITKVVERYCGCKSNSHPTALIHQYEIWNEPHLTGANGHSTFYAPAIGNSTEASAQSMVELERIAYTTIKAIDPTATVVSPSAGGEFGLDWFNKFLAAGGTNYADVIAYHMYVDNGPEQMGDLVHRVRAKIDSYAPTKPLWNTEAGWSGKPFTPDEAAAYVARAYLLNWTNGAQRFYWYAWDDQWWTSLRLTTGAPPYPGHGDHKSINGIAPAGIAYDQIYSWIVGATVNSCGTWESGLWKCELTRPGGYRGYILWTTEGTQLVSLPDAWKITQSLNLAGNRIPLSPRSTVQVGIEPVLFETANPITTNEHD